MRNDVSVVATVMSVDPDCQPEIAAMLGVSIALSISEIPWDGPISGVSVGLIDGEYVINPTEAQREVSRMAVTVASTSDLVAMIEAGAKEVTNDEMFDGIMFAHKENQRIVEFIKGIQAEVGKKKIDFPQTIPRLRCTRLSRISLSTISASLLTPMTSASVTSASSPSMRRFMRSSTRFIPTR